MKSYMYMIMIPLAVMLIATALLSFKTVSTANKPAVMDNNSVSVSR